MKKCVMFLSALIFSSIFITGCETVISKSYLISVDSINNKETVASKKCIIYPALREVGPEDLQFKEFSGYLAKALREKGYQVMDKPADADIVVFLAYGLGEPKEEDLYYELPYFGEPGDYSFLDRKTDYKTMMYGSSASVYYDLPYSKNYDPVLPGADTYVEVNKSISYALIRAYDIKSLSYDRSEKQLWRTDIIIRSSSGDLRYDFPFMITAAMQYLGEDTEHKVEVIITEEDKILKKIKGK